MPAPLMHVMLLRAVRILRLVAMMATPAQQMDAMPLLDVHILPLAMTTTLALPMIA